MSDCTRCTAPTDASLCQTCVIALRIELVDVAGLLPDAHSRGMQASLPEELAATYARFDQLAPPFDHSRGASADLPFRPKAGEILAALHNVLARWVSTLGGPARLSTTVLAEWLLNHLDLVRTHPQAAELAEQVTTAIHAARDAIDRPNDQTLYLGPCGNNGCPEHVYGWAHRPVARCPVCGAEHTVTARQEWLRRAALDYLGTATEISRFLRATGMHVTTSMLYGYVDRGRLLAAGHDGAGHRLFRVSDAVDVLSDRYRRRVS